MVFSGATQAPPRWAMICVGSTQSGSSTASANPTIARNAATMPTAMTSLPGTLADALSASEPGGRNDGPQLTGARHGTKEANHEQGEENGGEDGDREIGDAGNEQSRGSDRFSRIARFELWCDTARPPSHPTTVVTAIDRSAEKTSHPRSQHVSFQRCDWVTASLAARA